MIGSEKVVHESAFEWGVSHAIIPAALTIGPASYGNDW
jgi:hypothetical protein